MVLLQALTARQIPLAVASSSRRAWVDVTLHALAITSAFREVLSGDDVACGKPAPDIYLLAAERLGVQPSRCVAVEDSPNGVTAAHAAGMQVIGVRTPYTAHLTLEGAAVVVDSLARLGAGRLLLGLPPLGPEVEPPALT